MFLTVKSFHQLLILHAAINKLLLSDLPITIKVQVTKYLVSSVSGVELGIKIINLFNSGQMFS